MSAGTPTTDGVAAGPSSSSLPSFTAPEDTANRSTAAVVAEADAAAPSGVASDTPTPFPPSSAPSPRTTTSSGTAVSGVRRGERVDSPASPEAAEARSNARPPTAPSSRSNRQEVHTPTTTTTAGGEGLGSSIEPFILFAPEDTEQQTSRASAGVLSGGGGAAETERQAESQRRRPTAQQPAASALDSDGAGGVGGSGATSSFLDEVSAKTTTAAAALAAVSSGSSTRASASGKPRRSSGLATDGSTRVHVSGAMTPRSRPTLPEDEELTQLGRSLRSEIVGEHFLLTAGFSASSRGQGSGSRPASAFSNASTGAAATKETDGDRRGSANRQRRAGSAMADALVPMAVMSPTAAPVLEMMASAGPIATAATAHTSSYSSPLRVLPVSGVVAAFPRPDSRAVMTVAPPPSSAAAATDTRALSTRTRRTTRSRSRQTSASEHRSAPRRSSSASATVAMRNARRRPPRQQQQQQEKRSRECADGECGDLHTVAELRRRLLTEDFFSNPIRKLRRDGKFPWKLFTSVVLCVLLLLQVSWYQLPLARADDSMRRAITEHFMGDDYASKGRGDIVEVPTLWMEGLYTSVEHYVEVYYNLSNTSSSDINYYTVPLGNVSLGEGREADAASALLADTMCLTEANASDAAATAPFQAVDDTDTDEDAELEEYEEDEEVEMESASLLPDGARTTSKSTASTPAATAAPVDGPPVISVAAVAPVRMRVKVDVYSRREGAHHVNTSAGALAALSRGNWWGWTSSATLSAGRYADEVEDTETRWLTFYVDAAHPLGPFAKYRDAARRLSRASKQRRRLAHALKKAEKKADKAASKAAKKGNKHALDDLRAGKVQQPALAHPTAASDGEVDVALVTVCMPRLDELSGRYYRPCASVPPPSAIATTATDNSAAMEKRRKKKSVASKAAAAAAATPSPPPLLPSSFFPEFSLMDNVREIRLEVMLRHETGEDSDALDSIPSLQSGSSSGTTLGSFFRRRDLRGITGSAVGDEAAVFQWRVEKVIQVHPGGLVETRLHVETRTWPKGNTFVSLWGPSQWLAALLGVLAVLQLLLRGCALWRIQRYKERLRRERIAFHARQMHQQSLPHHHRRADHAYQPHRSADSTVGEGSATSSAPFSPATERRIAVAAALPYEWGLPGSPAARYAPEGSLHHSFPLPPAAASTHYGTVALSPFVTAAGGGSSGAAVGPSTGPGVGVSGESGRGDPTRWASPLSLPAESTPLLMRDTSLSVLAVQHLSSAAGRDVGGGSGPTAFQSDAEGDGVVIPAGPAGVPRGYVDRLAPQCDPVPTAATAATTMVRRATGSWFGRQLSRVFPRHLTHVRQHVSTSSESLGDGTQQWQEEEIGSSRQDAEHRMAARRGSSPAAAPTGAATGVTQGSLPAPLLGSSPLTPQLKERILERSYVDLRTTWRHHLQQSMGTGWHCVGIVAASLTLAYSALLLVPLVSGVEVAQDGRYDAWTSVLLGTAALTSCVLLLSYLRFFPTLCFPVLASTHVLPKLFLFALCVSPLFFGFAFFFKIAFGPYSDGHFKTVGWASMGLYMMTYGDSLLDTVDVVADTPYAVTAFLANVMVIVFALLFMMIILNIAMTITQHEWLRLRRRFGAALNTSTLLFAVRSRAEVRAEAVEAVQTNLEVLWFLLAEKEEERAAAAAAATGEEGEGEEQASEAESQRSDVLLRAASSTSSVGEGDWQQRRQGGGAAVGRHRHRRVLKRRQRRSQQQHRSTPKSREEGASGSTSRRVPTASSSYEVSAATTAPAE